MQKHTHRLERCQISMFRETLFGFLFDWNWNNLQHHIAFLAQFRLLIKCKYRYYISLLFKAVAVKIFDSLKKEILTKLTYSFFGYFQHWSE
jgi:hypothetical protein